ncbi:MAG: OmpA family protein [Saprospiraceae bacterium]|nr:OmpA family protein [Saprospiraceae bacterium]MCB9324332.1 OmpA family protein [Lewinellaceae bacterium]
MFTTQLYGQTDTIYLTNPSFEDFPQPSHPPRGWTDCGWPLESPPDTHPAGNFEVVKPAYDGATYLGMVVRDNETWESVSQRLSQPMKAGNCYSFTIMLARSELYVSVSQARGEDANYTTPVKLKIYGGLNACGRNEILGETKEIVNHRWVEYKFKFEPSEDFSYITLEAFYKTPTLFPYNGNVLLDKASAIVPVPCEELVATNEDIPEPDPKPAPKKPQPPKPDPKKNDPVPPKSTPEPKKDVTLAGVERAELKEGQVIQLKNVYFKADSSSITAESYEALNNIYDFLSTNKDVAIEIGGHTNSKPSHDFADNLSNERAKSVMTYLVNKGIDPKRIKYKGYGKRNPISTNSTPEGRKLNQRVEIKILNFNG